MFTLVCTVLRYRKASNDVTYGGRPSTVVHGLLDDRLIMPFVRRATSSALILCTHSAHASLPAPLSLLISLTSMPTSRSSTKQLILPQFCLSALGCTRLHSFAYISPVRDSVTVSSSTISLLKLRIFSRFRRNKYDSKNYDQIKYIESLVVLSYLSNFCLVIYHSEWKYYLFVYACFLYETIPRK